MTLRVPEKPRGQSSVHNAGSMAFTSELNPAVTDSSALGDLNSYGFYEHVLRTNPIAALGYLGMLATLQSVTWVGRANRRCSKRVVKYTDELFDERMERRLKDVLATAWLSIPCGASPHEVTTYHDGGYLWIKDLEHRPMRTFEQHSVWRGRDGYVRGTQNFYRGIEGGGIEGDSAYYGGPKEWGTKGWLWWVTYGSGIFGNPLIRPIVTENATKEDLRRGMAINVQKVITPTPVVYAQEDTSIAVPKEGSDEYNKTLDEVGAAIMTEQAVVGVPRWVREIKPLFASADGISKAIEAENHCDIQTLLLFGAAYWARGLLSSYGSSAAAKVDITEQRNFRKYFLDLGTTWLQYLINWFVTWNFGRQRYYPEMVAVYRPELTSLELARGVATLRKSGFLGVSDADEDFFRQDNGLPERDPAAEEPRLAGHAPAEPATPGRYDKDTGDDSRNRESEEDEEDNR